jgi:hypothetical protein
MRNVKAISCLFVVLCLYALPAKAQSYNNTLTMAPIAACMNDCLSRGYVYDNCSNKCNSPGVADTARNSNMSPDFMTDQQRAKDLERQEIENQQRKVMLRQQQFGCVNACKDGGQNEQYCQMTCTP